MTKVRLRELLSEAGLAALRESDVERRRRCRARKRAKLTRVVLLIPDIDGLLEDLHDYGRSPDWRPKFVSPEKLGDELVDLIGWRVVVTRDGGDPLPRDNFDLINDDEGEEEPNVGEG